MSTQTIQTHQVLKKIMTTKQLQIPSGYTTDIVADDALAIAIFGLQGSGKTKFMVTAPDPIGIVPLDRKSRKTIKKHADELGKTVIMPKEDFIRVANPMEIAVLKPDCGATIMIPLATSVHPKCCAKHYYRWHINRVKRAAFDLYAIPSVRSIGVDTGTQLWEDLLFAHYGRADRIMPRDRGPANQEMIDFLNALSGKNLVITHKAAEVWKNDKPTGKFESAGFRHLGYHVNVIAEMVCDDKKVEGEEGRFAMNVKMCQANPEIQGPGGVSLLTDDEISFPYLANRIYPDDDIDQWM